MANNRLIAVCIHSSHEPPFPRETVLKYYPNTSWYACEGNDEFFAAHRHESSLRDWYSLWGNHVVFVPEIRGIEELNRADDGDVALKVAELLHGAVKEIEE